MASVALACPLSELLPAWSWFGEFLLKASAVDVQIALFHVVAIRHAWFLLKCSTSKYILREVRPGTPEAVLSVVVGVSWTDDGHNHRQGAPFLHYLGAPCIFTDTF